MRTLSLSQNLLSPALLCLFLGGPGLLACSGDKPIEGEDGDGGDEDDGDGGTTGPECTTDTECADWEICETDACVDGDRNNSVEEAEGVLWDDEDGAGGYINPVGDSDFYRLTADGGEFVRIRTIHEFGESGGDTVVTLRSPSGKVVTFSDDYPTGGSTTSADSTIYAYLAQAGDYSIEVEDAGSYYDREEQFGSSDYSYQVTVESWSLHTEETDAADDPSVALEFEGSSSYSAVGVLLEEEGDSDFIEITHGLSAVNFFTYGMLDLSGSDAEPLARLWSEGEEIFFEKEGLSGTGYAYGPFLPAGTYTLELTDVDGAGGDDHWFFVFPIFFDAGDAYPVETEPNDQDTLATDLDMTETSTSGGSDYAFGQATGYIDALDDEDWFRVEARPDAELVVCLNAAIGGSLVSPVIEVYDSTGALVATGDGDASTRPNSRVEDLTMGSGDYYVRIADPAGLYSGAGAFYRFVVYAADFDVSSYEDGGYSCPA